MSHCITNSVYYAHTHTYFILVGFIFVIMFVLVSHIVFNDLALFVLAHLGALC